MVFHWLVDNHGNRNFLTLNPKPRGLKEKFALWVLTKLAPRFTIAEQGGLIQVLEREAAENEWRDRISQRPYSPRNEDLYLVRVPIDEETGEIVGL